MKGVEINRLLPLGELGRERKEILRTAYGLIGIITPPQIRAGCPTVSNTQDTQTMPTKTNQLECIFADATRLIDSRQDRPRRMEPQKAGYSALAFFVVVLHNQIWLSGYLFKSGEHLLYNFQNRTICPKCQLVVDDRFSVAYTIITI